MLMCKGNWSVCKWTMILQLHWPDQLAFPRGQSALPYIYGMFISQSNWLKIDSVCRYCSECRTSLWRHQFLLGLVAQLMDSLLQGAGRRRGGREAGRDDPTGTAEPCPGTESSATLLPCWEGTLWGRQGGWGLQGILWEKDESWGEGRTVCLCKDSIFTLLVSYKMQMVWRLLFPAPQYRFCCFSYW